MRTLKNLVLLGVILANGCQSKLSENYHMDKKYWDHSDYHDALMHIKYSIPEEEGYPRLSDPETAPVFYKLVDKQNVSVILEDESLGLKYRNEVAKEFFNEAGEFVTVYQKTNVQDKFIYPVELVKSIEFFLHTQILYFKLGNDAIIKDAVNPDANEIKRLTGRNAQTIVNNFHIYIELLTQEDAFSEVALSEYAKMIDVYYTRLITEFPEANYNQINNSAKMISKRVKSGEVRKALENIIVKIDAI